MLNIAVSDLRTGHMMPCRFHARREVGATAVCVGDMHWIDLPAAHSREQRGRYPTVVLRDGDFGGDLPVVLVVPLIPARTAMRCAGTMLMVPPQNRGYGRHRWRSCFNDRLVIDVVFTHALGPCVHRSRMRCVKSLENARATACRSSMSLARMGRSVGSSAD